MRPDSYWTNDMALADTHVLDAPEPPVCLQGREQTDKATAPSPLGPASRQKSQVWLQQAQGILGWTLGIHICPSLIKRFWDKKEQKPEHKEAGLPKLYSGTFFFQGHGFSRQGLFPQAVSMVIWSYGTIYL